jgi:hypothetical protein
MGDLVGCSVKSLSSLLDFGPVVTRLTLQWAGTKRWLDLKKEGFSSVASDRSVVEAVG